MNKKALLVALIVAALGGFLSYTYLQRFEQEASGGAPIRLLVLVKPVEPGTVLSESMLATRVVPQAYVENRAVRDTERAKVIGLRVSTSVQAQQSLMWTDLAIAADDRRELSQLVQPGMRAVGVRAGFDEKSIALMHPGDRVDIIAVLPKSDNDATRSSVVLLQNVLVLAVGMDIGAEVIGGRAQDVRDLLLTLSVNIPEAQMLALAGERGRLNVALRNPDDVRTTEGLSDFTSAALLNEQYRERIRQVRVQQPLPPSAAAAPQGPVRLPFGAQ